MNAGSGGVAHGGEGNAAGEAAGGPESAGANEGGEAGASNELGGAAGEESSAGAGGSGTSGTGGASGSAGSGGSSSAGGGASGAGNGGVGASAGNGGASAGGTSGSAGASTNGGGVGGNGGGGGGMVCTPLDFPLPAHPEATRADIQAILDDRCITCHTPPTAPMGLDLTNIAGVVGQASQECTAKLRIKAGSAFESYLMDKVLHTAQNPCTCFDGEGMPFDDDPLTNDQLGMIQSWINAGAN